MRVAAGGIALKVLQSILGEDVKVRAALVQMGKRQINRENWDWDEVNRND